VDVGDEVQTATMIPCLTCQISKTIPSIIPLIFETQCACNKIQKQVVEEEYEKHDKLQSIQTTILELEMIVLLNHVQIQKTTKRKAKRRHNNQRSNDIGNEVRSIKKPK